MKNLKSSAAFIVLIAILASIAFFIFKNQTKNSTTPATATPVVNAKPVALPALENKYLSDLIDNQDFKNAFVRGIDWAKIKKDLGTESPIKLENGYYYGSSCKPHSCPIENVMFAINKETGKGFLIFKNESDKKDISNFTAYTWNPASLDKEINSTSDEFKKMLEVNEYPQKNSPHHLIVKQ